MKAVHLILQVFRRPDAASSFDLAQWDLLLRQARQSNLLATLHAMLEEKGLLEYVPPQARTHMQWASRVALRHTQAVRWEVTQIRKALADSGVPIILLKGAAYVLAQLPAADGRLFSDIDILVPKRSLNAVEAALMQHGWIATQHDAYDQRYYRNWMHELPPMQHIKRMTVIDVHHAILPETATVRPDPEKLRAASRFVAGYGDLKVLSPVDMVLHSATHLFHDGELENGLRDLVDLDRLLRHFGGTLSFWQALVVRAAELDLTRPLFYALRYTYRILNTDIPAEILGAARIGAPNRLMLAIMDSLFMRALMPPHPSCADCFTGSARWLLYVRANWLRMPPLLLARHLFHKAFISAKAA